MTDVYGNQLDGDWVNPASMSATNSSGLISTFPSGDNVAGGQFDFVITLLAGDANLDGEVDTADLSILNAYFGPATNLTFENADFNGDGLVDTADLSALSFNFGFNLQVISILADEDDDGDVDDDDINNLEDLNKDGFIDGKDLALAVIQYGIDLELAI